MAKFGGEETGGGARKPGRSHLRVGGDHVKPKVYVETSVVSYLTAGPSRDVVILGNQVATREWWRGAANRFELVVSSLVIEESSDGDPEAARARLAALEPVHVLAVSDEAMALGGILVAAHAFPAEAGADAVHAAIAALNGVDYLVTWNMRHLANPVAAARIEQVCRDAGHEPPVICTPSQLREMEYEQPHR